MEILRRRCLWAWLVLVLSAVPAPAQKLSVLYDFGSQTFDPTQPTYSGIISQGRDGNLYSTAPLGGGDNVGAIFEITPKGTLSVPYSFDGSSGSSPTGGLTLSTDGVFY